MSKEIDLDYVYEADATYNGPRCKDCEHWKPSEEVKVPGFAHCDALRDTCGMVMRAGDSWAKHCPHYKAKCQQSMTDNKIIELLKEAVHNTGMLHDLSKQAAADASAGDWQGCYSKLKAMSSIPGVNNKVYGGIRVIHSVIDRYWLPNPKDPAS